MKTKYTKTMPCREYLGDRPLWTPEVYFRLLTADNRKKSLLEKIKEALTW